MSSISKNSSLIPAVIQTKTPGECNANDDQKPQLDSQKNLQHCMSPIPLMPISGGLPKEEHPPNEERRFTMPQRKNSEDKFSHSDSKAQGNPFKKYCDFKPESYEREKFRERKKSKLEEARRLIKIYMEKPSNNFPQTASLDEKTLNSPTGLGKKGCAIGRVYKEDDLAKKKSQPEDYSVSGKKTNNFFRKLKTFFWKEIDRSMRKWNKSKK